VKPQDIKALEATGQARKIPTTRELLLLAAETFRARGKERFRVLHNLDDKTAQELHQIPITGTALELMDQVLAHNGIVTDHTAGGVGEAYGMDPDRLHRFICFCVSGETIDGFSIAHRLTSQARSRDPEAMFAAITDLSPTRVFAVIGFAALCSAAMTLLPLLS
jgi:hypothetical protein